jgi:16S rRNA (guanine527-N7)-methyltransferase
MRHMPPSRDNAELFASAAAKLGLHVSRETLDRLDAFSATLRHWQRAINLVSPASLDHLWSRHFLDSAQVALYLPSTAKTVADLGSGAGLPGLVLAALRPDLRLVLIESDGRKAAFLGEAARHMGLANVRVVASRIELAAPVAADVVTARALAPLSKLLAWADRHRSDTAICLFHKGKGWRNELTEAMKDWDIPYDLFTSVTDRDAVILRIGPYSAAGLRHRQPEGRRRQDDDGD